MQNSSQTMKKARRSFQTYSWGSRWSRTTAALQNSGEVVQDGDQDIENGRWIERSVMD
jgi:hypothetical protein